MVQQGLPWESAAQPVELTVSATGEILNLWQCRTCRRLYDTERSARYCHASDCKCQGCDNRTEKVYTYCEPCREKRSRDRWLAMPEVGWDGVAALAIHGTDHYFFTPDELADYCGDEGVDVGDLMLVVCKHVRPPCFCLDDFLSDLLPDDQDAGDFGIDIAGIEKAVNDAAAKVAAEVWEAANTRPSVESLNEFLR